MASRYAGRSGAARGKGHPYSSMVSFTSMVTASAVAVRLAAGRREQCRCCIEGHRSKIPVAALGIAKRQSREARHWPPLSQSGAPRRTRRPGRKCKRPLAHPPEPGYPCYVSVLGELAWLAPREEPISTVPETPRRGHLTSTASDTGMISEGRPRKCDIRPGEFA